MEDSMEFPSEEPVEESEALEEFSSLISTGWRSALLEEELLEELVLRFFADSRDSVGLISIAESSKFSTSTTISSASSSFVDEELSSLIFFAFSCEHLIDAERFLSFLA